MLYAGNRLKIYGSEFTGIALPGQMNGEYSDSKILPLQNMSGFAKQVLTITVPATVDNSATYTLTVNGGAATVSFTTDASATQGELQDGLFDAWRSNAIANSIGTISKSSTNLLVTANAFGISNAIAVNTDTTNDLSVAESVAAGTGNWIKAGVIVVRATGEPPNTAKLPAAASNKVLGVTKLTRFEESETRGANREDGYPPQRVMDVVADVGVNKGIWVRTVESGLTEDSTVFADVAVNPGYVTATTGSNIALAGVMKVAQAPVKTLDGDFVVCMNYHL